MRIGIIGLPASGKSTVYRLLTHGQAGHHPGRPGEAATAVVRLPDPRLERLASLFKPKKMTPATIEVIDLPPFAKESGKPASPTPQALPQVRQADALLVVLRAFHDERVPHIEWRVDTAKDATSLQTEMLLADLDLVEKRIAKIEEGLRKGKRDENLQELALLKRCREGLEAERPLRTLSFQSEEDRLLRGFQFLTAKPILFLANLGEDAAALPPGLEAATGTAYWPAGSLFALPAKLELELADLPSDEASAFRAGLGLKEFSVPSLLHALCALLTLNTFFTVVGEELRAWLVPRGATVLKAAGTIHTDMERGFIRAEVVAFDALSRAGSLAAARKEGTLRLEGKDYVVADGDVITIRFNI
jgi:GTP-binding protein YchF